MRADIAHRCRCQVNIRHAVFGLVPAHVFPAELENELAAAMRARHEILPHIRTEESLPEFVFHRGRRATEHVEPARECLGSLHQQLHGRCLLFIHVRPFRRLVTYNPRGRRAGHIRRRTRAHKFYVHVRKLVVKRLKRRRIPRLDIPRKARVSLEELHHALFAEVSHLVKRGHGPYAVPRLLANKHTEHGN